jgi:hypothetical protein
MFHKLDQKKTYGVFYQRKFMSEGGRPMQQGLISCIHLHLIKCDSIFFTKPYGKINLHDKLGKKCYGKFYYCLTWGQKLINTRKCYRNGNGHGNDNGDITSP